MANLTKKKVKNILDEYMSELEAGKKPSLLAIQKKHGYSDSSAKGYAVTRTSAWKDLMEQIDDSEILDRLRWIVGNKESKDSDAINAADKLLKLKGRYPKLGGGIDRDIAELYE